MSSSLECYASNTDYPHHNVIMWKQNGEGNKWHWILNDLDYVFAHDASWNMFKYMLGTDNPEDAEYASSHAQKVALSRCLYEKMMSFPEFRNRFLATYATYLGDFLRHDVCKPIIRKMYDEILDEIAPTFAAYNNMSTREKFTNRLNRLWTYVNDRPKQVYQQMADYFSLGHVIPVSILNDEDENRSISVCDTPLRTGRFDGAWFTNFPLSLLTDDNNAAWIMTVTHKDGKSDTYTYETTYIQPDFSECMSGDTVTFKLTNTTIIDNVSVNKDNTVKAIFDITGKKIPAMKRGINIILYSEGTRKKVIVK